ncbi:MAG: hypothetical protein QM768_21885 [Agriterribacter sp.]
MKRILFIAALFISAFAKSQTGALQKYIDTFNVWHTTPQINSFLSNFTLNGGGDAYYFMPVRDRFSAWVEMYEMTKDTSYGNVPRRGIDSLIKYAKVSNTIAGNVYPYKDSYYGWIDKQSPELLNTEAWLSEGYMSVPIYHYLYLLKKFNTDQTWYNDRLTWCTTNIWTKWRSRSWSQYGDANKLIENVRTHMGSHMATVAQYLIRMTTVDSIKQQCQKVIDDYNVLLKRNLKLNPLNYKAYTWNQTWDDTTGTSAIIASPSLQDNSHGNHVISYVCIANELGDPNWQTGDVMPFVELEEALMYKPGTKDFWGYPNQTAGTNNNYVGDGWMRLARYKASLFNIYASLLTDNYALTISYNQTFNYRSRLVAAYKALTDLAALDTVAKRATKYVQNRNKAGVVVKGVAPANVDNIKYAILNGDTIQLMSSGEITSIALNVKGDSSRATTKKLQDALNNGNVSGLVLMDNRPTIFNVTSIYGNGKRLRFANGAKLAVSLRLKNITIDAAADDYIIIGTPDISGLKTASGKLYAAWFGVGSGLIQGEDQAVRLNFAIKVAAENGLELILPSTTLYLNSTNIVLKSGLSLDGNGAVLNISQSKGFTATIGNEKNITLKNMTWNIVDTVNGNAGISLLNATSASYGIQNILLENITIDANKKANNTMYFQQVSGLTLKNVRSSNSANHAMYIVSSRNIFIDSCSFYNSGATAIRMQTNVQNYRIRNFYGKGMNVVSTSIQGMIDISTTAVGGGLIENPTIVIDSSSTSAVACAGIFAYPAAGLQVHNPNITLGGTSSLWGIAQSSTTGYTPGSGMVVYNPVINVVDRVVARIFSTQNAYDFTVINPQVSVATNVSGAANMKFITVATNTQIDSTNFVKIDGGYFRSSAKIDYLSLVGCLLKNFEVKNVYLDSLAGSFVSNTGAIKKITLTGNSMRIAPAVSGAYITLGSSGFTAFEEVGNNYYKANSTIKSVDGSIVQKSTNNWWNYTLISESGSGSVAWADITSKPTTLSGFGITDAVGTGRTITINGTTYDLSANRSWSVGTVSSVGLSLPSIFSVSGSPVTGSGTLSATLASQTANYVFAAPNGSSGTPAFRALVAADIPSHNHTQSNITDLPTVGEGIFTASTSLTAVLSASGDSLGYMRVGSSVVVWGQITGLTNVASNHKIRLTLPVTTSFPNSDKHSVGVARITGSYTGDKEIVPVASQNQVEIAWTSGSTGAFIIRFNFSYRVYNN